MRPRRRILVGRRRAAAAAALALLAVACGDAPERAGQTVDTAVLQDQRIAQGDVGRDTLTPGDSGDTTTSPTPYDTTRRIIFVLAADSAEGFLLYHRKAGCIACHGADGQGLTNLGPSLRDSAWLHIEGTPAAIAEVVRTGIARPREAAIAMPGLAARLEPREVDQVAAYVYSLSHPGSAVSDTAAARRDSLARLADTLSPLDTLARSDTLAPPRTP